MFAVLFRDGAHSAAHFHRPNLESTPELLVTTKICGRAIQIGPGARLRRRPQDDTLAGVRHLSHRWAIVLLVVARLILGEFAYSMPHDPAAATDHVQGQSHENARFSDSGCPEHGGAAGTQAPTDSTAINPHHGAAHDANCCKTSCSCPCLHLSAIVTGVGVPSLALLHQQQLPGSASGHTPERVFLLLRPPA